MERPRLSFPTSDGDFPGVLSRTLSAIIPGALQSLVKNLSPLKFVSVLETLVSQCEGIGTFVDKITKSVREVGSCSARATKAIAGHTSTFVAGAAGGALGVLIKALVGDLPKQFVGWLKKGKDAILNLIRKLLRKMLKAVKDVFGKKGNQGPTDLEGQAATCPMISLKDKNSPTKSSSNSRKHSRCFVAGTPVGVGDSFQVIETIHAGQKIWSWNQETGEWQIDTVAETFQTEYSGQIFTLTVAGETIECTARHPFRVICGEGLNSRPLTAELVFRQVLVFV